MEKIINYHITKNTTSVFVPGVYTINGSVLTKYGKYIRWIIKKLIKYKFIEEYYAEEVSFSRVVIDPTKVADLIKQLYKDIYRSTNKQPKTIIMGYDKMRQLDIEIYEDMRFNMPLELHGPEGRKIYGLDVILNPRIDGVVVM
jgi:hypothetical protein